MQQHLHPTLRDTDASHLMMLFCLQHEHAPRTAATNNLMSFTAIAFWQLPAFPHPSPPFPVKPETRWNLLSVWFHFQIEIQSQKKPRVFQGSPASCQPRTQTHTNVSQFRAVCGNNVTQSLSSLLLSTLALKNFIYFVSFSLLFCMSSIW